MDFGALTPEINSARMYAGPGSGPMMAAAAAWSGLAAELRSAAAAYHSVISGLSAEDWRGPASASMAAAAAPYAAWMSATAAQAEQAANQATAAAGAFENAFAMTVPPPVVAANRAQLVSLVATNVLGQNTPAIAATEAHYGQMWAQDTAAMYGYAANSAAASKMTPFTSAPQTANPAAQAGQAAAVAQATGTSAATNTQTALSQFTSTVPTALQNMASPTASTASTGLGGILGTGLAPGDITNAATNLLSSSVSPMSAAGVTQIGADAAVIHSVANGGVVGPLGGVIPGWGEAPAGLVPSLLAPGSGISAVGPPGLPGVGALVSANMGRAGLAGALSVPQGWAAATPVTTPPASASLVSSWATAAPAAEPGGMPGMPGMPMTGSAGRGFGLAAPRYGFKLTVMPRPVLAG
ncbi:MAG: PPE family protein [Mycobacterium sp.]